ncbi:MAG: histidinol dehydrogenase [Bacteroidia bacterium]|nr:histidinol dehydrogenase [Bacteroidia bacterium]
MKIIKYPSREKWAEMLKRPVFDSAGLEQSVQAILNDVKQNGDAVIRKYALQFDKAELTEFAVTVKEFGIAEMECSAELKQALKQAKSNIEKFHLSQKEEVKIIETVPGVECWRKSVGIERVGLYIPGGSAPLFSTVLMLGVPAIIAGCNDVILCTPCDKDGKVNAAILVAAKLVGISKVYKIGGVQAIAAMAYGTQSISKVFKIFGPGNQYVTCAKQLVNKEGVAIDMPAGPSEVLVLADETCVPAFVAADLLSQAEHGSDSQVLLISDNEKVITDTLAEVQFQLRVLSRAGIAAKALENSRAILVKDKIEAIELVNEYAPEHLILACKDCETLAEKVINAGSVFIGNYSPESAGDYASGTNHTLPTNGFAKSYSGVSLDSFVRKITFQKLSKQGLEAIGKTVELMAASEGLDAHKNAVSIRLKRS